MFRHRHYKSEEALERARAGARKSGLLKVAVRKARAAKGAILNSHKNRKVEITLPKLAILEERED